MQIKRTTATRTRVSRRKIYPVPRSRINNIETGLRIKLKAIYTKIFDGWRKQIQVAEAFREAQPIAVNKIGEQYRNDMYVAVFGAKRKAAQAAVNAVGRQTRNKGLDTRFFNQRILPALKRRTLLVVDQHIVEGMEARVKAILSQGMMEGATQEQIIAHLDGIKGNYATIARTETHSAANEAGYEAATQTLDAIGGVTKFVKGWQTSEDEDVRETHVRAGEDYGEGREIPVEQNFKVGAVEMPYPGEYGSAPEEVINCRCNYYIVPKEG